MFLAKWARLNGFHKKTAVRMYRRGDLPKSVIVTESKTKSGRIQYHVVDNQRGEPNRTELLARVAALEADIRRIDEESKQNFQALDAKLTRLLKLVDPLSD